MTRADTIARFRSAYPRLDAEHQKAFAVLLHLMVHDPKVRKMTRPDELDGVLKLLLWKPAELTRRSNFPN